MKKTTIAFIILIIIILIMFLFIDGKKDKLDECLEDISIFELLINNIWHTMTFEDVNLVKAREISATELEPIVKTYPDYRLVNKLIKFKKRSNGKKIVLLEDKQGSNIQIFNVKLESYDRMILISDPDGHNPGYTYILSKYDNKINIEIWDDMYPNKPLFNLYLIKHSKL